MLGIVSESFLDSQLATQLQTLTKSGGISTSTAVFFLMNNALGLSATTPPTAAPPYIAGYPAASGSTPPILCSVRLRHDRTGRAARHLRGGPRNRRTHERSAGQQRDSGVGRDWRRTRRVLPRQLRGGRSARRDSDGHPNEQRLHAYHPQELAFFSWFFNSPTTRLARRGEVNSPRTALSKGRRKNCPPGGTN